MLLPWGQDAQNQATIKTFLSFAIDHSKQTGLKDVYTEYTYVDEYGTFWEKDANTGIISASNGARAAGYQPLTAQVGSFRDIVLPMVPADKVAEYVAKETNGYVIPNMGHKNVDGYGVGLWKAITGNGSYSVIDGDKITVGAGGDVYELAAMSPAKPGTKEDSRSLEDRSVAKLPTLWVKSSDNTTFVKIFDFLDPWDYQMAAAVLMKDICANDNELYKQGIDNANKGYESNLPIKLDCFGNIVSNIDGQWIILIPASVNKHITTEPVVNLVNLITLTGASARITKDDLVASGQSMSADSWGQRFLSRLWGKPITDSANEKNISKVGGIPAISSTAAKLAGGAVAIYYDTDMLLVHDWINNWDTGDAYWNTKSVSGDGMSWYPYGKSHYDLLKLDLFGTKNVGGLSVTPKMDVAGVSVLSAENTIANASNDTGQSSLLGMVMTSNALANILPSAIDEQYTSYVQEITYRSGTENIFGSPSIVAPQLQTGGTKDKKNSNDTARKFIDFIGSSAGSARLADILSASKGPLRTGFWLQYEPVDGTRDEFDGSFVTPTWSTAADGAAYALSADTTKFRPTSLIALHAEKEMSYTRAFASSLTGGGDKWSFNGKYQLKSIFEQEAFMDTSTVDLSKSSPTEALGGRWVKVYAPNKILAEIAEVLGMRGDTELAAANSPWIYLTYLKIYGVDKVKSALGGLNKNPTKFDDRIFDSKSSPLFTIDITEATPFKSQVEKDAELKANIYDLLNPTGGLEYKRKIISNIISNFVYDQYGRVVFGRAAEFSQGGFQNVVSRSQTGFLKIPSLEDNFFTGWFIPFYVTVALWCAAGGTVFIIVFGLLRRRKVTWFLIALCLLVVSIVGIPFINDMASSGMDIMVQQILRDKTTLWSLAEMTANNDAEDVFMQSGLSADEAERAAQLFQDIGVLYVDRTLMLRQDISHKINSLGNYADLQEFASTRWVLPAIIRQFSADNAEQNYMYVPLQDVVTDAANVYWYHYPSDAPRTGTMLGVQSDINRWSEYADDGNGNALSEPRFEYSDILKANPWFKYVFSQNRANTLSENAAGSSKLLFSIKVDGSFRSFSYAYGQSGTLPHTYFYMLLDNVGNQLRPDGVSAKDELSYKKGESSKVYWERFANTVMPQDPDAIASARSGGEYSGVPSASPYGRINAQGTFDTLENELETHAQTYSRQNRSTMFPEAGYLLTSENLYPYFYALVKDTMRYAGAYNAHTGELAGITENEDGYVADDEFIVSDWSLGSIANALTGHMEVIGRTEARSGIFHQTFVNLSQTDINKLITEGAEWAELSPEERAERISAGEIGYTGLTSAASQKFTGLTRDILDLENVFSNLIPYMYRMNLVTGGLDGNGGLWGGETITKYALYKGLPKAWLYRSNWAAKIIEAPAYNRKEEIGLPGGERINIPFTCLPEVYETYGRRMVFSEAQMYVDGLTEADISQLELKCVRLNKAMADKWTQLLNYANTKGVTPEIFMRQMALDALVEFNLAFQPGGVSSGAFALYPTSVDLRSLSFDSVMKVITLNATKDATFVYSDVMEGLVQEYDLLTMTLLWLDAVVCCWIVTLARALFLAMLFGLGVFGVLKGAVSSNDRKFICTAGYALQMALLFLVSFIYYWMFNLLMSGAAGTELLSSGITSVKTNPSWSYVIIFAGSIVYVIVLYYMSKTLWRNWDDLGFARYREIARAGVHGIKTGVDKIRSSHAGEGVKNSRHTEEHSTFIRRETGAHGGLTAASAAQYGSEGRNPQSSDEPNTAQTKEIKRRGQGGSETKDLHANTPSKGNTAEDIDRILNKAKEKERKEKSEQESEPPNKK